MAKPENLGELVQRYGYAKHQKIKLYGKELELVSDPSNQEGDDVFVDAREKGSEHVRQVQVPRNVVEMAKSRRSAVGSANQLIYQRWLTHARLSRPH